MLIIKIVTILFLVLEAANVVTLYFFPGTTLANGVGVFRAWEKAQRDPEIQRFVRYLVNWVAGTKLIFLLLLIVIIFTAGEATLPWVALAMALAIASFFWRLFPLARQMDQAGELAPRGYSKTLGGLIAVFVLVFLIAGLLVLLQYP
ncbi:MAG: hypothetical protein JW862_18245 [Anaerolineales bacterium]|nr:hypothetical protein [Anaerolineales bacterium]